MKYTVPRQLAINRVGVELEGGWLAGRGIRPYGDGSVTVSGRDSDYDPDDDSCYDDGGSGRSGYRLHCSNPACYQCRDAGRLYSGGSHHSPGTVLVGEICSQPLTISAAVDWVLHNYPDRMNSSCGMHVHVSMKSMLRYSQLMDDNFRQFFRKHMEAWAKGRITSSLFWSRWRGDNDFCKDEWIPDEQSIFTHKGGPRYTCINYCYLVEGRESRFGDSGEPRRTLECRVFPVFQEKETAAAVLCKFLGIIETYVRITPRTEQAVEAVAAIEETDEEETIVCA